MGRCVDCGRWAGIFESRCKECDKKRLDVWVKAHTFQYGDKVEVLYNKTFYKEPRYAIVMDRTMEEAWGYYSAYVKYKVKFESGEELWLPTEELEKVRSEYVSDKPRPV